MSFAFFAKLLNIVLPPICGICKEFVNEENTLCPTCFKQMNFITKPYCKICGRPFEFAVSDDCVCSQCLMEQPLFSKARSVLVYNDASKKLILPFKNGDRLDLAPLLAKMMQRSATDMINETDIIIPVPLHRWRLFKRKYNQSAILAQKLAKIFCKEYSPDALKRIRASPSQGHLTAKERRKNVVNAFHVKRPEKVYQKSVLLIDDVLTTGATANECAKVLLKSGASQVFLLTIASTMPNWKN